MKKLFLLATLFAAFTLNAMAYGSEPDNTDADLLKPLINHYLADGREILASAEAITVYVFDNDTSSESTCYGGCARAWPPVLAPAAAQEFGSDIGTTTRRDGSLQLTYKGKPVYFYVGDALPGDITGDGLGGIWHIVILE